jgi:hypothetical protein
MQSINAEPGLIRWLELSHRLHKIHALADWQSLWVVVLEHAIVFGGRQDECA